MWVQRGQFRPLAVAMWERAPRAAATSFTFSREAKNSCFISNISVFKKCWQLIQLKFKASVQYNNVSSWVGFFSHPFPTCDEVLCLLSMEIAFRAPSHE